VGGIPDGPRAAVILRDSVLAIIPARKGSKRLKNKNIRHFCGKPLISWTIEAALDSQLIDDIVVTSDHQDVLGIANDYGVACRNRPKEFSSDEASSFSVAEDVLKSQSRHYGITVLLQPTSPLRTVVHIDQSLKLMSKPNVDAVIGVTQVEYHSDVVGYLGDGNSMDRFGHPPSDGSLNETLIWHRINGALYCCRTELLLEQKTFLLPTNSIGYIMPRENSLDIDVELDFLIAEFLKSKHSRSGTK
jgi:CMP-N,N'-diacetyllegionaminic acid synthase